MANKITYKSRVEDYLTFSGFPLVGTKGIIYIDKEHTKSYL